MKNYLLLVYVFEIYKFQKVRKETHVYDFKFKEPTSNNESGVLAKLWRTFLDDNRLNGKLPTMVETYLDNDNDPKVTVVRKKNRSTLYGNIAAPEMTIKTFFDLMFNLVRVRRIEFSIKVTFPTGKESIHTVCINNGRAAAKPDKDINNEDKTEESKKDIK